MPSRNPSANQYGVLHDRLRRRVYAMCQKWLQSVGWGWPTDRWNVTGKTFLLYFTLPYLFYSCMPLQPKRLNRLTRTMAQITRYAVRKSLLGGRVEAKLHFGVKTLRKPKIFYLNAKFPAKSIYSNNVGTERDRRKISPDHLNKIGVGESNREAISALGRHLAAKTTFGPILKVWR
jgi:hypothetical protein